MNDNSPTPLIISDAHYFIANRDDAAIPLMRWTISILLASIILSLFLIIILKSEYKSIPLESPLLILDYIVLQPHTKKPLQKPKPIQKKATKAPKTEPVIQPVAEAPVEPSVVGPGPADIVSTPEPAVKKAPEFVRIRSVSDLDNINFEPLYNPKPRYPSIAMKAEIEGFVDVDLIVNYKGRVEKFSIVRVTGHSSFGNETSKVIAKWRFPPPRIGGNKVKIKYLYRINFQLD